MPSGSTQPTNDSKKRPILAQDGSEKRIQVPVYDPDQNPEEKRQLRQDYRALTRQIEEQQANPHSYTANDVLAHVNRANSLFDKVKQPQEATLDSNLLLLASNLGASKARAMKSGSGTFDVDDFISKLVVYMGGAKLLDEENAGATDGWPRLRQMWLWTGPRLDGKHWRKSRRAPAMGFMYVPLSIEQKKRAQGKRAKHEKEHAESKAPQQLKEEDIQRSENETTKNVSQEGAGEINIFKFVINPNNFAQSVENIFYLSFLIRDGKVAFETNDEGEPIIYACQPPSDEDYQNGLKKQQMVLEFDMAVWKRAIEVFNITKSMIPERKAAQTKLGGKWYG
ncbi:Nse4 C-terminal-domain-containing protein [Ephemerocybe angulata]|uniref:Non-structural maintenance of chromosomes element 4 n=1 Tax=Ephemerocybe angulata TaxID=980116 RepID=A0A8H6M9S3_9AGAR|nr:Nse4 C-terminal-domain-containing protein [Tulosesus angulatus]